MAPGRSGGAQESPHHSGMAAVETAPSAMRLAGLGRLDWPRARAHRPTMTSLRQASQQLHARQQVGHLCCCGKVPAEMKPLSIFVLCAAILAGLGSSSRLFKNMIMRGNPKVAPEGEEHRTNCADYFKMIDRNSMLLCAKCLGSNLDMVPQVPKRVLRRMNAFDIALPSAVVDQLSKAQLSHYSPASESSDEEEVENASKPRSSKGNGFQRLANDVLSLASDSDALDIDEGHTGGPGNGAGLAKEDSQLRPAESSGSTDHMDARGRSGWTEYFFSALSPHEQRRIVPEGPKPITKVVVRRKLPSKGGPQQLSRKDSAETQHSESPVDAAGNLELLNIE